MNRRVDRRVLAGFTMHWRIIAIACSIGLLAPHLCAQDGDDDPQGFRAAREGVRFALAADGEVSVAPDPRAGGPTSEAYPFGDPEEVFGSLLSASGGVLHSWSQWLFLGGERLTDATDALRFFERLGRLDRSPEGGMALLQLAMQTRHGEDLDPHPHALLRRLAVHALADLGFKPAIGRLEKLASDASVDDGLRDAARRAVATLRGDALHATATDRALPPLRDVLRRAPAEFDLLIVVDRTRLPAGRGLLAAIRSAGVSDCVRQVQSARGAVGPAEWAGVSVLTERFGLVAWELARRYGDHRIDRVVLALRFDVTLHRVKYCWLALDGAFDLPAIRAGLPSPHDALRFQLGGAVSLEIEAHRAIATNLADDVPRLGEADALALADGLPDAPLRGLLRRLPWQNAPTLPATRFGLELPEHGEVGAVLVLPTDAAAALADALRTWLGTNASGAQFTTLAEAAKYRAAEHELRIEIPRGAVEPGALLLELGERR